MTLDKAIRHCEEVADRCVTDGNLKCEMQHRQLAEWLKELKLRRTEQRWIPCSERLPEDEGEYLVSFDDGFIATTGYYEGDFELWADAGEPLAWQPLPEAYREEE